MSETRWIELSRLAELLTAYPFRASVRSEPGGNIPVIQLQDLATPDGGLPESVVRVANLDGRYDKHFLQPTDLLFQARGHKHAAAVVRLEHRMISMPGLHIIRPKVDAMLPDYLAWCLNHPRIQAAIATVGQGTHQPFVSKQSLAKVMIPAPPIETQRRIAETARLWAKERLLAAQLIEAKDALVDSATWHAAVGTPE